ncbi:MAG: hypothetical protein IJU20_06780 [Clostridia bacterium]|nr:hypothetical protein [Clostridia bacterium]
MHLYQRVMALLLATLLFSAVFVSCGKVAGGDETDKETENGTGQAEMLTIFAENAQSSEYTVMRSDYSNNTETAMNVAFRKSIVAATGVSKVELKTDWITDPNEDISALKEILVGETNRAESAAAKEQLGENEFIVCQSGNKLVLIGYDLEGTQAAIDYLLAEFLGYDEATGEYSKHSLEVPKDYFYKGTYEHKEPEPTKPATDPSLGEIVYLVEKQGSGSKEVVRKESTTPTKPVLYVTPEISYDSATGTYSSTYSAVEVEGDTSTFQTVNTYMDSMYFRSDAVMCYVAKKSEADGVFSDWMKVSDEYTVNMMMAINRDNGVYVQKDPKKVSDIQTRKDGSYFIHSGDTNYYMVPTLDWIEYIWDITKYCVEKYAPDVVTYEEPEMWFDSGYSQGFKDEWERYYEEDWMPQTASAEAMYMTMKLKTYLFQRILTEMEKRIHELNPDIKIYIASHSTVNYASWNITPGLNTYMSLGVLDGIIGQTWSDTSNVTLEYKGNNVKDNYLTTLIDYSTYLDSVRDTTFYALSDPMADGDYTEEQCRYMYRQTLVASLMQPEVHRFQMFPWPSRSFAGVSSEYRTMQLNVFTALDEIPGQEVTLHSGTPGISYLLSDSIGWQRDTGNWGMNTGKAFYGITYPLANDGIRTQFTSMENLDKVTDLDGISVLIVAYDCQKPVSAKVNEVLAQWVKNGGVLLYVAGQDSYQKIKSEWWAEYDTPLKHLISELGLKVSVNGLTMTKTEKVSYVGSGDGSGFTSLSLSTAYKQFYQSFSGTSIHPIMQINGQNVGIDEPVGKGRFIAVGIPGAIMSKTATGDTFVTSLVAYALQYTDKTYVSTDYMWVQRGNVYAGHAISKPATVTGQYIDLFDATLPVKTSLTVAAKDSVLLYDISKLNLSVPRMAFTGGILRGDVQEKADETTMVIAGPDGTLISSRYLAPANLYPTEVTAQTLAGTKEVVYASWDAATRSFLVQVDGDHDGVTVTVKWGKTVGDFSNPSGLKRIEVATNNKNEDEAFIYEDKAHKNDSIRYCDTNATLTYVFDLEKYPDATVMMQVFQNYVVEFSFNRQTWYVIADYSLDHAFTKSGGNRVWISLPESVYGEYRGAEDNQLYIRLRNTDPTQGWGGSITSLAVIWNEE